MKNFIHEIIATPNNTSIIFNKISGKAVQVKSFYKQVSGSPTVKLITSIKETLSLTYLLVKVNITIMKCVLFGNLCVGSQVQVCQNMLFL
jgi:hypothetical protein